MRVFAALLTLALLGQTYQQCLTPDDTKQIDKTSFRGLYTGQQGFSLALLQAINQLMPNENLFFSPYSTYHALVIAYFLAGNQTESYLKKALRLDDSQSKIDIYKAYKLDKLATSILAKDATYEFTSANKIYVSDQIKVRDCIESHFKDELEKAAFTTNPDGERMKINQWVEGQTHNMIKDLLPPGTVDQESNLILVNAAYFKGMWENKFDPNQTKQEVFYVNPSKQIFVDMMHAEGTFNHDVSEALGAHILEMPYEGNNISMYILLPPFAKDDAIDSTLKKLTLERFQSVVRENSLLSKTVQVALPKFTLEHTIELVPVLEKIGVGDLFQKSSDFSVLSDDAKVSVGNALHKARIEVNEEGTKAAAATAFFSFRSSRPAEPAQFICNHPFIYLIYNKVEQTVLFTGVFRRPYST